MTLWLFHLLSLSCSWRCLFAFSCCWWYRGLLCSVKEYINCVVRLGKTFKFNFKKNQEEKRQSPTSVSNTVFIFSLVLPAIFCTYVTYIDKLTTVKIVSTLKTNPMRLNKKGSHCLLEVKWTDVVDLVLSTQTLLNLLQQKMFLYFNRFSIQINVIIIVVYSKSTLYSSYFILFRLVLYYFKLFIFHCLPLAYRWLNSWLSDAKIAVELGTRS